MVFLHKVLAEEEDEGIKLVPKVEYTAQDLRDPFQSLIKKKEEEAKKEAGREVVPSVPLPALTIQGIVWGSELPQAIINEKVVKVGDTIEGVEITGINKEGVIVSFGGREYNLSSPAKEYSGSLKEGTVNLKGDKYEK